MMVLWALPAYFTVNWQGIKADISPGLVFYFAVYYVLGFLFFSAILAGLGSVCNTVKEAQSLMTPVTLITIIPMLAWFNLVRDPQGVLARVLSFVPPLTPMVMVLRISASSKVPLIEIIASIILLVVSVPAVIWLSAKVFRTGILMYGKRPGLREIIRWLRQS
jgi:ABC-2 type transport system permease protein